MLIRLMFLLLLVLSGPTRAEEPLPPEQAFRFSARAVDAKTIEARWQITDQYYMYRDKFKFAAEGGTLGAAKYPPGKVKDDENFGKVETYRKEVKILIPVEAAGAVTLKAVSQGCWDGGICYPPINQEARVDMATAAAPTGAVSPAPTSAGTAKTGTAGDETSRIAGLFKGDNLALVLASFFGFGLLLSLTPCVFPMIPILSGIIVNHGHAVSHLRAFILSLAYVLGMAVTYAIVGVAAGLSGTLLSAALQNAWVLGAFALVFVVLSLSMFGFMNCNFPPLCKAGYPTLRTSRAARCRPSP
jgi:thiol:disulfide interchange protein DsbD